MGLGIRLDYILSVLHPRSGYKRPMQSVYTQRLVAMVKRSLQIFIVFICVTILLLTFYLIKRRLSEFLNRRALNHPNRDEGELCGDDGLLVHIHFICYQGKSLRVSCRCPHHVIHVRGWCRRGRKGRCVECRRCRRVARQAFPH